jgi:phosphatidylglycerophosphatase C
VRNLALFDFDGTLTKRDTFLEFIKYSRGSSLFFLGFLSISPLLVFYKLGLLKNWRLKQIVLRLFFGGTSVAEFQNWCNSFAVNKVPQFIREEAFERIKYHKSRGDDIYVVSASAENWVKPYCESVSVYCIATKLVVNGGKISGEIDGRNCYGNEKVKRIKAQLDVDKFNSIFAYGDSEGDKEMLELADYPYYRKFS